jgi:iron uptake system component EfeO
MRRAWKEDEAMKLSISSVLCLSVLLCGACGENDDPKEPGQGKATLEEQATLDVKAYIQAELDNLADAAERLQKAAPEPDADGWNADDDAAAVAEMRKAWADARDAYERVEGAIAVLFPNLDVSTDERYDGFIEEEADEDLFDDVGVTGVHGIERILWAGEHPKRVVDFESALEGYEPAAFPKNEQQADDFKNKLAALLVSDTAKMKKDFGPLALDAASAYRGVIGSLQEQVEKVTLAATAEDESRYAQRTLGDMRANLEGGRATYDAFRAWVEAEAGDDVDAKIRAGFERVDAAYSDIAGDAIPAVPAGFDPDKPSAEALKTAYGKLWSLLLAESDVEDAGSLVSQMLDAADAMEIPQLPD